MRAQLEKSPHVTNSPIRLDSTDIPIEALKWLKSYGITDDEILRYCIGYGRDDYLYFRINATCVLGRYFGSSRNPRYNLLGEKPQSQIHIGCSSSTGIFVEDMISAIKVGRQYTALPILGSSISDEAILEAAGHFENLGIWLDYDMIRKSARKAQKARILTGCNIFRVHTKLDPKCYNNIEINMIVEEAKDVNRHC